MANTGTAISTLSEAAYSASMASLGGFGVMTGASAIVGFLAGFAALTLLKGDKNDPKKILKQLAA